MNGYLTFLHPVNFKEKSTHMLSSEDFFDFQGFLSWQTEKPNGDKNTDFISQLISTQAFNQFVEVRDPISGEVITNS